MKSGLGTFCDDFYISCRLFLKMQMKLERETVLHFFDRIRKEYPGLRKLRKRNNGGVIIEEEASEEGSRRWIRIDPDALRFGHYAPADIEEVRAFSELIVQQAPYHFSFSDIDFDHLELAYGFDLSYRGNHDQLVAETLSGDSAAANFLFGDEAAHVIDVQPYYGIALTPECDLQAYVEVKSRTTTYEVRRESHENQPISVLMTLRKYWGVDPPATLHAAVAGLFDVADDLATEKVAPNFVTPLAAAIASRS